MAHLLGYCHRCGSRCERDSVACKQCSEPFLPVEHRNELGLLYGTPAAVGLAQRTLQEELTKSGSPSPAPSATTPPGPPPAGGTKETAAKQDPAATQPNAAEKAVGGDGKATRDPSEESIGIKFDVSDDGEDTLDGLSDLLPDNSSQMELLKELERDTPAKPVVLPPQAPQPPVVRPVPVAAGAAVSKPVEVPPTPPSEIESLSQAMASPAGTDQQTMRRLSASNERLSVMIFLLLAINLITLVIWMPRIFEGGLLGPMFASLSSGSGSANKNPAIAPAPRRVTASRTASPPKDPAQSEGLTVVVIDGGADFQPGDPIEGKGSTLGPIPQSPSLTIKSLSAEEVGSKLAAQLGKANQLLKDGHAKEALAVLQDVARTVPPDQKPAGLDDAIRRLEEQIAHVEASTFFGIPIN